ncbi:uncharacterized protein [Apostichopus japonicus]|uniref:uncharacterized protein isoform X3 n=1 Tax=Stichopus japonicus TaxID=307972 RepID=UPI003AB1CB80
MFTMDPPPPFIAQGSEYNQGLYGQYPNKVNSPGFINSYNYCNQRNNLAYHPNQNGNVNQSQRNMSEQFQGTNFGEDEFEIPPLTLPSVPTTAGENNLPNVTMGDQNLPNQNMGYSGSPEGSSRSPAAAAQNQGSPQIQQQQHQQQVAMSPNIRQQTPDPNQPARQSHSPPESHPSMGGHSMTDSFSGGAMPTAQNYEVHEVSSSTFSEHVPQISESLTDISNSTHMSLNPQFPPHGLNIPPITESSANWIPEIGTNPPYTSMNNSLPVATTTSHLQQSYPSQHQHLGHVPSPHMVAGYHPAGQMTPDTILTTTYQSAISSVNTMPQMAMQPTMGSMHPPMTIPGQPGGPMMGTRISPPHRESSEDSDDNTPLSQFAAKQHLQPQQRVPPPPPEVKETKKKPPKRKRKKDPNEPQKPVSAYALFFRDTQAAIKGSNPNASFGEVSKIVASMWDSLEAEQKQAYKQKTETAKREYLKKLAAYRASLVSKAAVEIEPVDQIPSKKKGNTMPSPMYHMNPGSTVSPLMPMVPRAIAPKPMGNSSNLPMGHGGMLPSGGMMHQMHPMTQHMMTPGTTQPACTRNGCTRAPISNQQWDNEYCSNGCVVDNCRDVFNAWTAANCAQASVLPSVK